MLFSLFCLFFFKFLIVKSLCLFVIIIHFREKSMVPVTKQDQFVGCCIQLCRRKGSRRGKILILPMHVFTLGIFLQSLDFFLLGFFSFHLLNCHYSNVILLLEPMQSTVVRHYHSNISSRLSPQATQMHLFHAK